MRFEHRDSEDHHRLWTLRIRNWTGPMWTRARCISIFVGTDRAAVVKRIIEDDARSCSEELLLRLSGWKHGFARAACYRWITPAANLSCADAGTCRLDHSGKASIPAASIRHSTNWVSRRAHGLP